MNISADQRAVVNEARRIQRDARKAATKARPKSPKADRGRERDNAHLAFIRRLPCVATYAETGKLRFGCQAAHVRMVREGKPGGMGVKPSDKWTVPLTPEMHDRQTNRGGERGFWHALGIDPVVLAQQIYAVSGDEIAATKVIVSATKRAARAIQGRAG